MFFLANRKKLLSGVPLEDKEQKEISLEKLEKLVNKIKTEIITFIVVTNDKFRDYDPYEFKNKDEDIQVLDVDQEDDVGNNNSLARENSENELIRNMSGVSSNSELNLSRAVSMVNRDDERPAIRKKVKDAAELSKNFIYL